MKLNSKVLNIAQCVLLVAVLAGCSQAQPIAQQEPQDVAANQASEAAVNPLDRYPILELSHKIDQSSADSVREGAWKALITLDCEAWTAVRYQPTDVPDPEYPELPIGDAHTLSNVDEACGLMNPSERAQEIYDLQLEYSEEITAKYYETADEDEKAEAKAYAPVFPRAYFKSRTDGKIYFSRFDDLTMEPSDRPKDGRWWIGASNSSFGNQYILG